MAGGVDFDAIVVGAGPAGSTAATVLARGGLDVLLVERGTAPGSKNLSGGRLYGHALATVFPDFATSAPLERVITKERISLLTAESATTVEFSSTHLDGSNASYSVLRAPLDQWLADQAEAAGATLITGVRVDELLVTDGRVRGIVAGEDQMTAKVVLLADGALSLLARRAGLIPEPDPHHYAVGAKEVIHLGADVVSQRFGLADGQGCAWMFDGHATDGHIGGGFLYTNADTVSLGIVTTIGDLGHSRTRVPEMVERLKSHPTVAPLIAGGTMVEYGGHMALEGGYDAVPKVVHDGALLLGDAAGFGLNTGYTIRGMDLAIESGRLAAETVIAANGRGDFSATSLDEYTDRLKASFVLTDMKFYRRFPAFLEDTPRLFAEYPRLAEELMLDLFSVDGEPPVPLTRTARRRLQRLGLVHVLRDAWRGMGAVDGRTSAAEVLGGAAGRLRGTATAPRGGRR
jgi:electron transfer flavoprotein-quinone oxidoreductase